MILWQQIIIFLFATLSVLSFIKSLHEIKTRKNPFGITKPLTFLGIFVWGDALVLGPFWLGVSIIILLLQDWNLFLLIVSLFWVVRSSGEILYWIAEQFADKHRNPPSTLFFYSLFKNDAVWFIYQLFWQCVLVIAIIASLYFANAWLE